MPAAERFRAHGVDAWHGSETASRAHRACTAHVAAVSLQQPDVNSYHTLRNAPAGVSGGSSGFVGYGRTALAPAIDVEFHTMLPKYCFVFFWARHCSIICRRSLAPGGLRPPHPPGALPLDPNAMTSIHQPSNERRSQILDSPLYSNSNVQYHRQSFAFSGPSRMEQFTVSSARQQPVTERFQTTYLWRQQRKSSAGATVAFV